MSMTRPAYANQPGFNPGAPTPGWNSNSNGSGGGGFKFMGATPAQLAAIGFAGGPLASMFNQPKFRNPADAGMDYLKNVPEALRPYFQPQIERGERSGNSLESQYGQMTSDPSKFLGDISKNYQQSPGYQWRLQQAMQAGNNAAMAGGMAGSPAHQQMSAEVGEGLANKDYEDWLNHALEAYHQGQTGMENFYNKGSAAGQEYGTDLAQNLMNQGSWASRGVEEENKWNQSNADRQAKGIGDIAAMLPLLLALA